MLMKIKKSFAYGDAVNNKIERLNRDNHVQLAGDAYKYTEIKQNDKGYTLAHYTIKYDEDNFRPHLFLQTTQKITSEGAVKLLVEYFDNWLAPTV